MSVRPESALADGGSSSAHPLANAPIRAPNGPDTVINPERRILSAADEPAIPHRSGSTILKRLFPADVSTGDEIPLDGPANLELAHFQIIERIGTGGMGAVFRALDRRLQRIVALKVLAPAFSRDVSAVQRFQNEARATALLDHDNIAGVYFVGEDQGVHFIAYEYIEGVNLRELIRQRRKLDPVEAVNYTLQIATALSHMAAAGVTHRDIKPSNIIVTSKGRAKLVDLGLARKQNEDSLGDLTMAGTTLGTFDYISPEQAKDPRQVDVRSDIYSLGCTLYHMLTGAPPYPEGTVLQKLLDHQGKEPPNPRDRNRRVPDNLSNVVRKMMASDPRRRYANPELLIRDLMLVAGTLGMRGQTAEGLVWTATTASTKKFWARHLGWMSTAAALLLIVIAIQRFPELTETAVNPRAALLGERNGEPQDDAGLEGDVASGAVTGEIPVNPGTLPENDSVNSGDSEIASGGGSAVPFPGFQPPDSMSRLFESITPLINPSGAIGRESLDGSDPQSRELVSAGTAGASVVDVRSGNPTAEGLPAGSLSNSPTIVLYSVEGDSERSFTTLEAACAAASDGSVIELRYNGRHPSGRTERPLQITDKKVTIRAQRGFRPWIEFGGDGAVDSSDTRMITLNGGSIELVNVDLFLRVDESVPSDLWALFSLRQARQVLLSGVSIQLINPGRRRAAVMEFGEGFQASMSMDLGGPDPATHRVEFSMTESVVVAAADLFLAGGPEPGRLEITESALVLEGVVLQAVSGSEMPLADQMLELKLEHTTSVTLGLVRLDCSQIPPNLLPLEVVASNNIVSLFDSSTSLVTINGEGTADELQRLIRNWYGSRNFFDGIDRFWTVQVEQGSMELMSADFSQWLEHWSVTGDSMEAGSLNQPVPWAENWRDLRWNQLDVSSLQLFKTQILPEGTAIRGASDGRDAGADLVRLPLIPAASRKSVD